MVALGWLFVGCGLAATVVIYVKNVVTEGRARSRAEAMRRHPAGKGRTL